MAETEMERGLVGNNGGGGGGEFESRSVSVESARVSLLLLFNALRPRQNWLKMERRIPIAGSLTCFFRDGGPGSIVVAGFSPVGSGAALSSDKADGCSFSSIGRTLEDN